MIKKCRISSERLTPLDLQEIKVEITANLPLSNCTHESIWALLNDIHARLWLSFKPLVNAKDLTITGKP